MAMAGTVSRGFLSELENRRAQIRAAAENMLLEVRSSGREQLNQGESERYAQAQRDLAGLDEHIEEIRQDLDRSGVPERLRRIGQPGADVSSAGRLAPLAFSDEAMRNAHRRLSQGETAVLETRDFSSAVSDLPREFDDIPTFPRHESRLLDRLPGFALEAPSLEYIQVNSIVGSASIVGEGSPNPS